MPAVLDTFANGIISSATSLTWSHTVGSGANRILIVGLSTSATQTGFSSVTYGGVALTRSTGVSGGPTGTGRLVEIWYLVNPTVGTANIVATCAVATAVPIVGGSASGTGVNQASPLRTPVTLAGTAGTSVSVTAATGVAGDVIFAALSIRSTAVGTPGANLTARWSQITGANLYGAGATEDPSVSKVVSYTWTTADNYALAAVPLADAANLPAITVNGGSNQIDVIPYATVNLSATSNRAGATFVWSTASGIPIVGSGANVTAKIPPANGGAAAGYVFTVTVTDATDGATTSTDIVVSVLPGTDFYLNNANVWVPFERTPL